MQGDAFALAGLGGFNAHGAGFLAAARRHGFVPDLITATSGQISVVADWLLGKDLRQSLISVQRENDPFAELETVFWGYPGVFRPAYAEALLRLWRPPSFTEGWINTVADRLLPAQAYVSERDQAFFAETAATLNHQARIGGTDIGVVFNAYDFDRGKAVLYGNDRARHLLPTKSKLRPTRLQKDVRYAKPGADETEIRPITPDAVKAALWLSLYGFEGLPHGQMDGAYHRSCLVSELHDFSRLFIARPLANSWVGKRPRNWFQVQDWQSEMWFSVGYKAELDALKRINQLVESGHLRDKDFKNVEIYEIEPETPAGYFNYFIERDVVYDRAYEQADRLFGELGAAGGAANPGQKPPRMPHLVS